MVATSVSMVVQFKPIKKTAITSKKGCDAQLRGCSDPITIVVQHERPGGDRGKKRPPEWHHHTIHDGSCRSCHIVVCQETPWSHSGGQSWGSRNGPWRAILVHPYLIFGYVPPLQYFLDLHFCWCHPLVWCHQHPCPPHPHAATVLARHALRLPMFQGPRGIIDLRQCTAKVWNRVRCRIPAFLYWASQEGYIEPEFIVKTWNRSHLKILDIASWGNQHQVGWTRDFQLGSGFFLQLHQMKPIKNHAGQQIQGDVYIYICLSISISYISRQFQPIPPKPSHQLSLTSHWLRKQGMAMWRSEIRTWGASNYAIAEHYQQNPPLLRCSH